MKNCDARVLELLSRARAVLERQQARTRLARGHVFWHLGTGQPFADEQSQRRH